MSKRKPITPPRWSLKLLRLFIRKDFVEEIEGDMEEIFWEEVEDYGLRKAKRRYNWQMLKLLRPNLTHNIFNSQKLNYYGMFKHNILVTFRGFKRHKLTFFINLVGLSTGLAASLLIYLWVQDERSVDTFHEKNDQLYWAMNNFQLPDRKVTWNYTPGPLANEMKADFPEVEASVRVGNHFFRPAGVISDQESHYEVSGLFASHNFFEVMTYPLLQGTAESALTNKESIVLSERLAIKIFKSPEQAIGQTVAWESRFFKKDFIVTGVFVDPPANATEQFEAVVSYDLLVERDRWAGDWKGGYAYTFLQLEKETDLAAFNEKVLNYVNEKSNNEGKFGLFLRPYAKGYLFGNYEDGQLVGGRIENVRLFSMVALLVLVIACINFMNLSTAQASKKMKEIGVKKAIGAHRHALVAQFLCESILLSLLSLIVAIGLINLFLPQFNEITSKSMDINYGMYLLPVVAIVLGVGILAGSYPAFYLSGFKPVAVLKGKFSNLKGEEWTRKGLVILQFTLSIVFIMGVVVINRQIKFTQDAQLGFDRESIVTFSRKGNNLSEPTIMISELEKISGVSLVANMAGSILDGGSGQSGYNWQPGDEDEKHLFKSPMIGYNTVETLGMEVIAGRSFSREMNDDLNQIMINEAAVEFMGLKNPVGTRLQSSPEETREIIGVVKDFQYGSLHQKIEPLIFRFRDWGRDFLVKLQPGTELSTLDEIEKVYKKLHPKYDFEASFLNDDYIALYDSEDKVAQLSNYMAGIAILVSCLGLFGLAAFTAERKTKEIGIRKVLGASRLAIMQILSSSFTSTILIAIALAIPIGYFLAQGWLQNFAYSINLSWWMFAIAGFMAMVIALVTVSFQTLKAANVNPVECLRHE